MSAQEIRLYAGPDLENAARLSPNSGSSARLSGMTNAAGQLIGRAANRFGKTEDEPMQAIRASVRVPGHTENLKVVYVGRGDNRAWLTSINRMPR